ncbi:TIGR02611 family protein [Vallicoccus soli]|uniref:TIGR02611 family protein n=1 Tax=Vallicoccus soli TaxID=2339232 RepID=A0A3A3YQL3_9ACTN|nr:TIGR02611 family protein [Vallicoccus soli]
MRTSPATRGAYRATVAVLGAAVVALGVVLLPLPGPGWLIIFAGLALLATEFAWAQRLLGFARERVAAWTRWLGRQSWPVRGAVAAGCALVVVLALGAVVAVTGVPAFLPEPVAALVADVVPGSER